MRKFFRDDRGNVLVVFAASLFALVGMAALAIDVGYVLTAKNQLQSAVDSSALAGAAGLLVNSTHSTQEAIKYAGLNDCITQPVTITDANVSYPRSNQCRVDASRTIPLFFGRALGIATATVTAMAVAEVNNINGTRGLKPWAIPYLDWNIGERVLLKSGELGAPSTSPGFFYPVDYPPLNRGTPETGADVYRENISTGSIDPVYIGDQLQVEPGNMIGPTHQGVRDLIAMDPYAQYSSGEITGSRYPGFDSPRVCIIPFYDEALGPDSGRNSVTIIGLGAFFVEGVSGQNVMGRFIEITTAGRLGGGLSMLKGVRLIQ